MIPERLSGLLNLPVEDRLDLAEELWRSVDREIDRDGPPIPRWQSEIIAHRLAEFERNPEDEQTLDEVLAELRSTQ